MATNTNELTIIKDNVGKIIEINISVPIYSKKNGDQFVAYSPDLRTFGFSTKSKNDALDEFDKAASAFLKIHCKRGTLEETLSNFGWSQSNSNFNSVKRGNLPTYLLPKLGKSAQHQISVPTELVC